MCYLYSKKFLAFSEFLQKFYFCQIQNLFINIIRAGYSGEGTSNRAETLATVRGTWGGENYLEIKNDAWLRLQDFYLEITK